GASAERSAVSAPGRSRLAMMRFLSRGICSLSKRETVRRHEGSAADVALPRRRAPVDRDARAGHEAGGGGGEVEGEALDLVYLAQSLERHHVLERLAHLGLGVETPVADVGQE